MSTKSQHTTRRSFLKHSTRFAVGASLMGTLAVPRAVHAGVGEQLRIGLIGAGLRGTAAAENALTANKENVLVAIGDAFDDVARNSRKKLLRRDRVKDRVQVPDDRIFYGFDAYKQVVDSGVDVILLAEPPHFRPRSLAYAIENNKHCFVEKPVAVDAPGIRSIIDTCRQAETKGLSVVSGLCWRYQPAVQETVRRVVEDKAIGEIVAIQSSYNSGQLWHRGDRPEWSRMEYQVRNWIYHAWLSGDHICEQAVHSLDKSAWLLGDGHPIQASALGGRQQRTAPRFGNVYDHFAVNYEFSNGVRVNFACRQQDNCTNLVDELVLGTKGHAWILQNRIEGEKTWRYEGTPADMYVLEHEALFDSIRHGRPINNGQYMANSNMMGIMGRMCAYTGKSLTWDQCFNDQERLGPSDYRWNDDVPGDVVPVPGRSRPPAG